MTSVSDRLPVHGLNPPAIPTGAASRRTPAAFSLQWLPWAFAFFNAVRVLSYLPTLWAIHQQGDASQHSLVTWLTWTGANFTMAAWLFEKNGFRIDRAVAVNACNAFMCLATVALIVAYRW